ncbi:MAG TPA: DUF2268 domain-containing putative Zn-dependent protease [Candidatus Saccharimonadales bacterium]
MSSSIYYHIANSTGELDHLTDRFISAFHKANKITEKELKADQIDVILVNAPMQTIKQLGTSGYSPGPHHIYVRVDSKFKDISEDSIVSQLLHETHHCMRWRDPGYGKTLGEAMISEGLATLYEEEHSGEVPIYAQVKIKQSDIDLANKELNNDKYNHQKWFFGIDKIAHWFGYSYGYKLAKEYSEKTNKKASELVHVNAKLMLP